MCLRERSQGDFESFDLSSYRIGNAIFQGQKIRCGAGFQVGRRTIMGLLREVGLKWQEILFNQQGIIEAWVSPGLQMELWDGASRKAR